MAKGLFPSSLMLGTVETPQSQESPNDLPIFVSPGLSTPPSARKGTTTADENENSIAHWLSHRNLPLLDPYMAFFQTNLTGKKTSKYILNSCIVFHEIPKLEL